MGALLRRIKAASIAVAGARLRVVRCLAARAVRPIYDILSTRKVCQPGPVAQLGARFNRTEEVAGSNPARSTFSLFFVQKMYRRE